MERLFGQHISRAAHLFDGWAETPIWSCLQGCMGSAWVNDGDHPTSAQLLVGDFCFLAGVPNKQLIQNLPHNHPAPYIVLIARTPLWFPLIETLLAGRFEKTTRYAFRKQTCFDRTNLLRFSNDVPKGYTLSLIDEDTYHAVLRQDWCRDFCVNYASFDDFAAHGVGVCAFWRGEVVGGASSYTYYNGGIEVELDTRSDHRRKGLGLACSAALILECLNRGLYPSWDAANPTSAHIAEMLGYQLSHTYPAYLIQTQR